MTENQKERILEVLNKCLILWRTMTLNMYETKQEAYDELRWEQEINNCPCCQYTVEVDREGVRFEPLKREPEVAHCEYCPIQWGTEEVVSSYYCEVDDYRWESPWWEWTEAGTPEERTLAAERMVQLIEENIVRVEGIACR
jgi:hypothetical protein